MLRNTLLLAALLGVCNLAAAQQNYSSLQPSTYTVNLGYVISGVTYDPLPCTNFNPTTSTCLPQVSTADGDKVIVSYSGPATAGNTISLMYCFSNYSAVDRAWRASNAVISKDKKCNVASPIAKGLPTGQGSYTWTPGPATPGATYQIQLLEVVAGSNPTTYAASGKSSGYFQIVPINSRPGWLLALVGVLCAVGPVTLAAFITWEKVIKKE